jgi:hypothetical protein
LDRTFSPDPIDTHFDFLAIDEWVFGQCNKILPVIANCRALANIIYNKDEEFVKLDKISRKIARESAVLGSHLRQHDENNELNRDEPTSTAFPSNEPENESSRKRYERHFVGHFDRKGNLCGILSDLKLIYNTNTNKGVSLTETGWRLALSKNPVLERNQEDPSEKISDAEKSLLIRHIKNYVPKELYAYRKILNIVSDGTKSPGDIDDYLRDEMKSRSISDDISDAHLSSQRSGAVSRMEDLDILERKRNGVKITYQMGSKSEMILG